jgi:palmitoyltransferase
MIDEMKIRLGQNSEKEIEKWVNKKTKKEGNTALHYASYIGNIDLIITLIKNKADVKITNLSGDNMLHMAARGNNLNSFVYFKEKFNMNIESIDEMNSTPLHKACYYGSDLIMNYILSFNIDINLRDKDGYTPLHLAVIAGKLNKL